MAISTLRNVYKTIHAYDGFNYGSAVALRSRAYDGDIVQQGIFAQLHKLVRIIYPNSSPILDIQHIQLFLRSLIAVNSWFCERMLYNY
jgi:hypothetical protein